MRGTSVQKQQAVKRLLW